MSHPSATLPSEPAGAPSVRQGGRKALLLGLVAAAAIYGLVGRWECLVDIPRYQVGLYGVVARNYVKYGYVGFGLAQISSPGPPLPPPQRVYYQNHPPLAPLLSSLGVAAFGPHAWAVLLPHLLCGLALVGVLAAMGARVGGGAAGAWCALLAAALPLAVRFGGAFVDVLGPALILWTSLASLFYLRYCETGRRADYWLLFAACVLGLLTDWPAYLLCLALAGHALVYRSRAHRGAMLVLPGAAVACFVGLMAYALSIPREGNLWQSVGEAARGWAAGGSSPEVGHISATALAADFAVKWLVQLSPFSLLAVPWLFRRAWPAVRTRENRRDQHVLLLWLWPVPYALAFPTIFYAHPYYHLLFLPAVVVTVGVVADQFYRGGKGAGGLLRPVAALAGVVLLILSSFYTVTMEDRWEPLRHQQVRWAQDLAAHTAFEEKSAFVLHYAQQMRFVADRAVEEYVDTPAKLEKLSRKTRVFVPLAHPFGDADLFGVLLRTSPATLCGTLVAFGQGDVSSLARGTLVHWGGRLEKQELSAGVSLEKLVYTVESAQDGTRLLALGPTLSALPRTQPGDTLEWQVRFLGKQGDVLGAVSMPAQASASYFVVEPKAWRDQGGRAELALRLCTTDAASVGRGTRLMRLALRFLTFRALGNPKPVVRSLGQVELTLR